MSDHPSASAETDDVGSDPVSPSTRGLTTASTSSNPKPGFIARLSGENGMGRNLGLIIALLLICVIGVITTGERFLSADNINAIAREAAVIGVVSIGVTFVITAGGIDLSVGSVLGLATVWASTIGTQELARDFHWLIVVFTGVAVGTISGLVTGAIVAYGRVVSFITSLAMLTGARGLAEIISGRRTQVLSVPDFANFFNIQVLGVSMIVWIFILVAVLGWVVLNRTTFGRRTIAVGGNAEAARLAGINVKRHTMLVFGLSGFTAGVAGVLMLARTTSGSSTNGLLYELDAIAAVVVGGTLLIGGRGTIVGTVFGVLIFATLTNIFILNNLSTSVQALVTGAILVLAVMLQQRFVSRAKPT